MIYTSYFAKLRSLPENIVPVSICGKAPDWYKGLQYKNLSRLQCENCSFLNMERIGLR